jgi:hypothetical protein
MNIRKEILNSDGQQFYQAQLSLTSSYSTQEKGITTYVVGNAYSGLYDYPNNEYS